MSDKENTSNSIEFEIVEKLQETKITQNEGVPNDQDNNNNNRNTYENIFVVQDYSPYHRGPGHRIRCHDSHCMLRHIRGHSNVGEYDRELHKIQSELNSNLNASSFKKESDSLNDTTSKTSDDVPSSSGQANENVEGSQHCKFGRDRARFYDKPSHCFTQKRCQESNRHQGYHSHMQNGHEHHGHHGHGHNGHGHHGHGHHGHHGHHGNHGHGHHSHHGHGHHGHHGYGHHGHHGNHGHEHHGNHGHEHHGHGHHGTHGHEHQGHHGQEQNGHGNHDQFGHGNHDHFGHGHKDHGHHEHFGHGHHGHHHRTCKFMETQCAVAN